MTQYTQNAGSEASALFDKTYSDLLVCFDVDRLYHLIGDEIRISGLPEDVKKNFSVQSLVQETEKAFVRLLERGALSSIQRFGLTDEAQKQIEDMKARANSRPRGTMKTGGQKEVTPQAPQSRWANLTQDQFDAMPVRESRALYKADNDFRAAVDRLAAEDATKAPSPDTTGRAYLRRKSDGFFFKEWLHGVDYWTPGFDLRADMTYVEAKRQIDGFLSRGVVVEAFELGNHKLLDFSPKAEVPKAEKTKPASTWKLRSSGLTTVGSRQRHHRPGTFILKATNGEFVGRIDDVSCEVVTVPQPGNAQAFTSRETANVAADRTPLVLYLHRHDGREIER
jgi:hypothetical protein